jgi:hypothetical protein
MHTIDRLEQVLIELAYEAADCSDRKAFTSDPLELARTEASRQKLRSAGIAVARVFMFLLCSGRAPSQNVTRATSDRMRSGLPPMQRRASSDASSGRAIRRWPTTISKQVSPWRFSCTSPQ